MHNSQTGLKIEFNIFFKKNSLKRRKEINFLSLFYHPDRH